VLNDNFMELISTVHGVIKEFSVL